MAEWYDRLSDEQIAWLKSNEKPAGLLSYDEFELFSRVPSSLREFFSGSACKPDPVCEFASPAGLAYRLRPEWERPKKKTWVHKDLELDSLGRFAWTNGTLYHWTYYDVHALDGFVGVIWKWRSWRWLVDAMGRRKQLGVDGERANQNWHIDANVEPPHPVAVRFRREVEGE